MAIVVRPLAQQAGPSFVMLAYERFHTAPILSTSQVAIIPVLELPL
jgi:hypothetical protein